MKNYKACLLTTGLAVVGFAQVSPAPPSFPGPAPIGYYGPTGDAGGLIPPPTPAPGLYLYDTATGQAAFSAAAGPDAVAAFIGVLGGYNVNISATGDTTSGGTYPAMDLDVALAVTSVTGDQLLVYYSNGTFGPSLGQYTLATTGPSPGGSVFTSAFLASSVFGLTTPLGGSADLYPNVVNAQGTINANNYYLTIEDAITGSEVSVDSSLTVVPESTTVVAAALMLLPLGIGAVRSLRKERTV